VDFDTPNARNASGRGGRTAAFKFYENPDNLLRRAEAARLLVSHVDERRRASDPGSAV